LSPICSSPSAALSAPAFWVDHSPGDAVSRTIRPGDLVVAWQATGADGPLPDTPEQAAQRKAWVGHRQNRGTSTIRHGPENVEHVHMH
jgi:hypothetical protein